jgi:dethiobiotin synthetase
MEGAGGIMVPLNEQCLMLDLMKRMGAAVLLVASTGLGTINHTLLSLEQLRRHGLEVFGIVLNGPKDPGNRAAIEHFGGAEVIAELEPLSLINEHTLVEAFERNFGERDNDTSQGVS